MQETIDKDYLANTSSATDEINQQLLFCRGERQLDSFESHRITRKIIRNHLQKMTDKKYLR